jgi:energy-coupling factor transporter ATP-binding protein EcfA2
VRVDYLKIDRFKNLNGFSVDLDETCEEPVTVVLGRNGSGKSNLFEALIIIFRDLIKGKTTTDFGYDLRYTLKGSTVTVRVTNPRTPSDEARDISSQEPFTGKEGEPITAFSFAITENGTERRIARRDIRNFLPRYVVTYYSGVSNRMEHHFYQP